jgi:hypothetical protein
MKSKQLAYSFFLDAHCDVASQRVGEGLPNTMSPERK